MKRQFAVFDIDGTISRTSLLQLTVRELVNRGKLGVGPGHKIEVLLHDNRQRIDDNEFGEYMKKAVDFLFKSLPDNTLKSDDYEEIINAVVKTSLSNTYVYTRELIKTLKQNNFFLIAISGSELKMVEAFSKELGFDAWVGEVSYEQLDGRLTGEVNSLKQPKTKVLESLIQKFELNTRGSTAVGDTSRDIGVLEMVDSPIVFNPNQELFKKARENNWMIVLERKDMVYGMVKEGDNYVLKQTNV
jgi:HAD superfamily phosphoserine phosphatase-like hydrolase